jgi:hypothetical protein
LEAFLDKRTRWLVLCLAIGLSASLTLPAFGKGNNFFPDAKGDEISLLLGSRTFQVGSPFFISHGMSGPPSTCAEPFWTHPDTRFELFVDGVNLEPTAIFDNCPLAAEGFASKEFLYQFRYDGVEWPLVGPHALRGEWWFFGGSYPSLEADVVVTFIRGKSS